MLSTSVRLKKYAKYRNHSADILNDSVEIQGPWFVDQVFEHLIMKHRYGSKSNVRQD